MSQEESPEGECLSLGGRAIRGSIYTVGASLVTLTLGFLRSVLLARLLLPEHFGLVALALFYIGLAAQLRGLGLDIALIHRQDADELFMRTYFSLRLGLDLL
ncbi:MAG: oligosaccharide flippase family protein, partial [Anaerolineae bacterium]